MLKRSTSAVLTLKCFKRLDVIPLGIDKQSSMPINKKEIQQKPTE